jgi:hypothetical protein
VEIGVGGRNSRSAAVGSIGAQGKRRGVGKLGSVRREVREGPRGTYIRQGGEERRP